MNSARSSSTTILLPTWSSCIVVGMSRVLKQLQAEGAVINQEVLAGLAPYRLEHINRFGDYVLDFRRKAEALDEGFRILEAESTSQGQ